MEQRKRTTKQRVDAALAFAEMSQEELEEKVGFSRSTFYRRRYVEGYSFKEGELYEIAQKCGVPMWFLEHGWLGKNPQEVKQAVEDLLGDEPAA